MSQFDPYGNNNASSPYQTNGTQSSPVAPSILNSLDQNQLQFFLNQGYTRGLLKKLLEVKSTYFQRCWIVDNGNAMQVDDSHRLVINQQNGIIESIDGVKRWDELLESISTQAWVSSYLNMPMRFAVSCHLCFSLKSLNVQEGLFCSQLSYMPLFLNTVVESTREYGSVLHNG